MSSPPAAPPHPLDAKFSYLSISHHDTLPFVTVVALNRQRKRNAINAQMWKEIGEAFRQIGTTGDGCRCVLLVGRGRGFCGGIDLTDDKGGFEDGSPGEERACETVAYRITDEWACRIFGINTPQYRSTLNFECRAGTNIEEGLLLEKGAIFDQWMNQGFPEKAECIMVTGRGYCDENTRALLKYVQLYFSNSPSDIDFPMKGLTDMGAAGVNILNALSKPGRPFLPHEHFNLKLGWIGLNPRFMREVFPNELYTAKSSERDDAMLENLHDPERGFVTAPTDDEQSNRRKTELSAMHSSAASEFDWTGPEGKKIDLDTLDESTLMCATKWFMKNDRHL